MTSPVELIIACPECESCFEVESDSIGPLGKKVRCSECHHTWVYYKPKNDSQDEAYDPPLAAREKSLRTLVQEAEDALSSSSTTPAFLAEEDENFEDEFLYKERVDHPSSFFSKIFLIFILGSLGFTVLFFARTEIVSFFPGTRPFYKALGLPIILLEDFSLKNTRWYHQNTSSMPAVCVEGELTNKSLATAYPPRLQISVRGEGDCRPLTIAERLFGSDKADSSGACLLTRWLLKPVEGQMLPGQTISFKATYPYAPGQRVTEVLLKLTYKN